MIYAYSKARAIRDSQNRKRGLQRLEKAYKSGVLNKEHLNKKGYNVYLDLNGEATVEINYNAFEKDQVWEGLNPEYALGNLFRA